METSKNVFITRLKTEFPKESMQLAHLSLSKSKSASKNIPLIAPPPKAKVEESDQDLDENEKSQKIKKWQNILKSICFKPDDIGYYKSFPIRPGPYFYKAIFESKLPLSRLGVKIPETIGAFDDFYWVGYNYETGQNYFKNIEYWASTPIINDRSKVTIETKHRGFVDELQWADTVYYKHVDIDNEQDPAVINRSWSTFPLSESIEVLTWDKLKQNYTYGPNADGIIQRFVYSPTHKATMYRLVFHNPTNSSKSNFGF